MKLRVDVHEDKAVVRGKVWPKDGKAPEDWTITVEDPLPIASGSPGLVSYSPAVAYFDNVRVTRNE